LTNEAPDVRCGITARVTLNTPFRFTLTSRSQYSSVVSSSGMEVGLIPAQLKTWWMAPSFSMTVSTNLFTSCTEDTSTSSWYEGVFEHDFSVDDRES
jgi:hypothetical protein